MRLTTRKLDSCFQRNLNHFSFLSESFFRIVTSCEYRHLRTLMYKNELRWLRDSALLWGRQMEWKACSRHLPSLNWPLSNAFPVVFDCTSFSMAEQPRETSRDVDRDYCPRFSNRNGDVRHTFQSNVILLLRINYSSTEWVSHPKKYLIFEFMNE